MEFPTNKVTDYHQNDIVETAKQDEKDKSSPAKVELTQSDDISSLELDKGVPELQSTLERMLKSRSGKYNKDDYDIIAQQEFNRGKSLELIYVR